MGLLDFIERGPERREWLDDNVGDFMTYMTPPNLRPVVEFAGQMNPIQGMADSMSQYGVATDPNRSMDERRRAAMQSLTEGLVAVAPAAMSASGFMKPAQASMEGLLGWSPAGQQIADDMGQFLVDEAGSLRLARGTDAEAMARDISDLRAAGRASEVTDDMGQVLVDEAGNLSLPYSERIASSTPRSWRDPKFDKPQWHPISSVSMDRPAADVAPAIQDLGLLSPEVSLRIDDLQGRVMTPALGDRTIAGVNVLGYDDVLFSSPVRSQGGRDFMREADTGLWASEKGPMSQKNALVRGLLEQGEDPALVYTAMGAQSGDFSTIMKDAMMGQFNPDGIAEAAASKFDDRMASLGVKGWPGTKSGKVDEALSSMTGSDRWSVWQEMDKAAYRDAGFPDVGKTRISITDPKLLDVDPFTSGLNIGRPNSEFGDDIFAAHPSYSHQIGGDYEGGVGNLPGQIVWRDFFDARRASGSSPASDQRAFMMKSPKITQTVDQQMVDEVNEWLLAQGDF